MAAHTSRRNSDMAFDLPVPDGPEMKMLKRGSGIPSPNCKARRALSWPTMATSGVTSDVL